MIAMIADSKDEGRSIESRCLCTTVDSCVASENDKSSNSPLLASYGGVLVRGRSRQGMLFSCADAHGKRPGEVVDLTVRCLKRQRALIAIIRS